MRFQENGASSAWGFSINSSAAAAQPTSAMAAQTETGSADAAGDRALHLVIASRDDIDEIGVDQ